MLVSEKPQFPTFNVYFGNLLNTGGHARHMCATPSKPDSDRTGWVFLAYLITGAEGLLFMIGKEAARLGWLERGVNSIFGDYAKHVLENLYGIGILLPFLLVPQIPLMMILSIYLIVKYWRWWQLSGPAVILLAITSLFLTAVWLRTYENENFGVMMAILCGLYFSSAFFVGLQWLIRKYKPAKQTKRII